MSHTSPIMAKETKKKKEKFYAYMKLQFVPITIYWISAVDNGVALRSWTMSTWWLIIKHSSLLFEKKKKNK